MSLLSALLRHLRPPGQRRVTTLGGLAQHVVKHATFISQKATWDYLRARVGMSFDHMLASGEFRDAHEYCRWEAYAAVLPDVAEATQVLLRRAGAPEALLPPLFARIVEIGLIQYPMPTYRKDWSDITAGLQARFARNNLAPPRPIRLLGAHAAARIIEVLPMDPRVKEADRDYIENNIRFLLVRYYEDSERLVDLDAIVTAIREGAELEAARQDSK